MIAPLKCCNDPSNKVIVFNPLKLRTPLKKEVLTFSGGTYFKTAQIGIINNIDEIRNSLLKPKICANAAPRGGIIIEINPGKII